MTERNQIWKCEVCGNIVEILHSGAGQLVCCGQPMTLMEIKREEEGFEKHLPVVERDGETVTVKVGSVEHPMLRGHYIEWIAIDTENGVIRRYLNPGEKPGAVFKTPGNILLVRGYCNVHGQWATEG